MAKLRALPAKQKATFGGRGLDDARAEHAEAAASPVAPIARSQAGLAGTSPTSMGGAENGRESRRPPDMRIEVRRAVAPSPTSKGSRSYRGAVCVKTRERVAESGPSPAFSRLLFYFTSVDIKISFHTNMPESSCGSKLGKHTNLFTPRLEPQPRCF